MWRLINWLWALLPDRCEAPDCGRHGVRGNENRVNGKVLCDGCSMRALHGSRKP